MPAPRSCLQHLRAGRARSKVIIHIHPNAALFSTFFATFSRHRITPPFSFFRLRVLTCRTLLLKPIAPRPAECSPRSSLVPSRKASTGVLLQAAAACAVQFYGSGRRSLNGIWRFHRRFADGSSEIACRSVLYQVFDCTPHCMTHTVASEHRASWRRTVQVSLTPSNPPLFTHARISPPAPASPSLSTIRSEFFH